MYLDPGFGGMLVQILVAIVAAGGAMAFAMRKKLRALFNKDSKKNEPASPSEFNTEYLEDDVIDTLSDEND